MNRTNLCESFEAEGVLLWLDGDLSDVERKRWQAHLATCETCQRVLSETETTLDRYDALGQDAPRLASIETILEEGRRRRVRDYWRPIVVAAAVVILVVQSTLPGWPERIETEYPLARGEAIETTLRIRSEQAGEIVSPVPTVHSKLPDRLKVYREAPRFLKERREK